MTATYENLVGWEQEKAVYLQKVALDLGMDLDGSGEIGVNRSSRYTYLYLEDYSFILYMHISCELNESDVWVSYINSENGEEIDETLDIIGDTYTDIENWLQNVA